MPGQHLHIHQPTLSQAERSRLMGHLPACLWFTGLSGSGKSTIANAVENALHHVHQAHTYLLDGDAIRSGLNRDLDFSLGGRAENIRRLAEVARLFVDAGLIVLTAFISPLRADRDQARRILPPGSLIEIYTECPVEVCARRDPKGLYQKARLGQIHDFTGVDSPYEAPLQPEVTLHTAEESLETCTRRVVEHLLTNHILRAGNSL